MWTKKVLKKSKRVGELMVKLNMDQIVCSLQKRISMSEWITSAVAKYKQGEHNDACHHLVHRWKHQEKKNLPGRIRNTYIQNANKLQLIMLTWSKLVCKIKSKKIVSIKGAFSTKIFFHSILLRMPEKEWSTETKELVDFKFCKIFTT